MGVDVGEPSLRLVVNEDMTRECRTYFRAPMNQSPEQLGALTSSRV